MPITQLGRADLHIHTNASDGKSSVVEVLNFVKNKRPNLDVIAITDHDTVDASLWAYEHQDHYPFDIVPGVEVSSRDGHILALWVTEPIPRDMDLSDTVTAIHEANGLAILAHPIHPFIPEHFLQGLRHLRQANVLLEAGLDGLETHNAGIAGTGCNWIAAQLAKNIGLAVSSGSDAHTLGAIGSSETIFPGCTAQALHRAIIEKKTVARGKAWSIKDYISYLKHERQRKAMTSSVLMNSSTTTKQGI